MNKDIHSPITSREEWPTGTQPVLPGAEPLYLKGNDTGILFLHGFTASAFEGKELAEYLHQKSGFTVSVPLLPGHGTRPEDLKEVYWGDWYGFTKSRYLELKKETARIFVCGQSMGGALALHLAAHHPVDGIITLAGAVFLKDWRLILLPVARRLITYHFKSKGQETGIGGA